LLAAISFAVALFHGHLGEVNFVTLGLLLLALHHAVGDWRPWHRPA